MILLTQFQHLYKMTKRIFFLVDQLCPLEIMVTENSQYAMNVTHTHTFNGPFSGTTGWWRGTVVERRSLAGELSLSCACGLGGGVE